MQSKDETSDEADHRTLAIYRNLIKQVSGYANGKMLKRRMMNVSEEVFYIAPVAHISR